MITQKMKYKTGLAALAVYQIFQLSQSGYFVAGPMEPEQCVHFTISQSYNNLSTNMFFYSC